MTMRRFLMIAIAGLVLTGASVSPAMTGLSTAKGTSIQLADGGWPPPVECGLYDICRVTVKS